MNHCVRGASARNTRCFDVVLDANTEAVPGDKAAVSAGWIKQTITRSAHGPFQ
jgi:hypothetical protein